MILVANGEPVFVGEIAHIVGAVPSGPRGSTDVVDRDAFENLLILCGRHHKIIDDPRTRDRYPVEVLREWKAKHEAEFDAATRAELTRLPDPSARLPELLVDVFRGTTADLEATVVKLEAAGHLARETAQMLHVALGRTGSSGPAVGDGVPGIKEAFEEAYDAAGGASFLGLPSADAYGIGRGVVQHLRGGRCGHPAVICALFGKPAVIVTTDLWNGISQIGDSAAGGGAHGVGFPVSSSGGDHRYIGPEVGQVATTGGSWAPKGTMVRDAHDTWRWTADLAFDPNSTGNADVAFDPQSRLDLRLRLLAQMPVVGSDLRVTAAGRRRLTTELANPEMTTILTTMATGRIDLPPGPQWRPNEDRFARNDSRGASYSCGIDTADGRPAIRGTLQYLMPHLMMSDIAAIIDVLFDLDACQDQLGLPDTAAARPLSLEEIGERFTRAWTLAFDVLPLALGERHDDLEPGGQPRVSLHIIDERSEKSRGDDAHKLADLVDLTRFGTTTREYITRLDIAILGRGSLPEHDVRDVVRMALIRAAEDAGFDAADLVTW